MSKKEVTLFIVEDDDIDYMTIERSLNKKMVANTIVRAKDGQEALEMLDRGEVPSPYIILLDIQMSRMNGLEFLKKLEATLFIIKVLFLCLQHQKMKRIFYKATKTIVLVIL
ncbi:response regulator [Pseudoalteromonas sp. RW-H-Ap-1]|uniref:response regulator n=1 Tax=Pseudoalteromonas sp. RW-H-Ap-1 TaxID=3241171 RepID=UPI00390CD4F9|nr:response regulator [Ningiella sp. W23]